MCFSIYRNFTCSPRSHRAAKIKIVPMHKQITQLHILKYKSENFPLCRREKKHAPMSQWYSRQPFVHHTLVIFLLFSMNFYCNHQSLTVTSIAQRVSGTTFDEKSFTSFVLEYCYCGHCEFLLLQSITDDWSFPNKCCTKSIQKYFFTIYGFVEASSLRVRIKRVILVQFF